MTDDRFDDFLQGPDWTAFDKFEADVRDVHLALLRAREVFKREPREYLIMHRWGRREAAYGPAHFIELWRQGWRPE